MVVFAGWIFSRHPANAGSGSISVGYRCLSQQYGAYLIPITATDGTGVMAFNLPTSDPNYQAAFAGQSVGAILHTVFGINSPALTAIGITTDATTTSQLAALTVVPPDPVYMQGPSLWSQVDNILQQWYGSRYSVTILGSGLIRVVDTYALTPQTLTFGTDPIVMNSMSEDTSESYTQVIIRGRENVRPATCSLKDGSLIDPNIADEATWNIKDFLYPPGGYDTGAITVVTSTQITVKSDSSAAHWTTNYWSNLQATVSCIFPAGTNAADMELKHITANTALTAGGTSVLTLDSPLSGSSYTRYQIRGANTGGPSADYRRYNITNTYVAQHLQPMFPFAVPFSPSQFFVEQTTMPQSTISYSSGGLALQAQIPFEIVPYDGTNNGYVLFYNPVVTVNNSQAALEAGGSSITKPDDVCVFVPFSVGTLNVQSPAAGGYSGTAYSVFGVQRTLYRDYGNWLDPRQGTAMQQLADAVLATVSQALQEGQVTYYGQYMTALNPGSPIALNLTHFSRATGYESMNAPCRSVTLEWPQNGGSMWLTRINFSTRRQAYSGDRLYVHANYAEGQAWAGGKLMAGAAPIGMPALGGSPLAAPDAMSNIPMAGQMDMTGLGMSGKDALAMSKASKQESLAASKAAARREQVDPLAQQMDAQEKQMAERTQFGQMEQMFGAMPRQD